jgi:tRNA/tmRNA/rRNA uracil-C5-methylase (TrmA/RlmC/RlmD family)
LYQIGDEITIEPNELVAGGAALAKIDGFPIFAPNVYPGDVAVVRLSEVKKGFARGDLVRIVKPSALRRAAPCPIADECGGCDWTSLRLDAQLDAKRRILSESLRRIGKIREHPEITIHPSALNYRLRSRLHREGDAVGFYAMRSNRVVPLARECEVVGVETAARFGQLEPSEGAPERSEGADEGLSIWEIDGRLVESGEMTIHGYHVTTDAFFQVNRHMLHTMLDLVSGHASRVHRRRRAVDLYAGVGFFTVRIAAHYDEVIAVEGSVGSVRCARRNVPPNVRVVHAPVEEHPIGEADFVFLDPPRAGTRRNVIESIAANTREIICFLACDPVTFSRDASRLIASGWRLATLDLLDLFPNTHHVETLASFERAT